MNRIDATFEQLHREGSKGFVAYITAGDPNLKATAALAREFERIGVDVLELGVPFSDPLADGVVNQLAAERGLRSGTTLHKILDTVAQLRRGGCEIPIVLFTYFNPVHAYGLRAFVRDATAAGVDGMLPLDLPPEEETAYRDTLASSSLRMIHLIAPNTPEARIKEICRHSSGFIYYVSREGVTGMQKKLCDTIDARVALIKKHTSVPVVIGFGVSTPAQARTVARFGDAVVVGSAIVTRIGKLANSKALVPQVSRFVKSLVESVKTN
jgi:tryptophan synthase alpha chain